MTRGNAGLSLAAVLVAGVVCNSGCASDGDSPSKEQSVSQGTGLPMPGNVNAMMMLGAAGAAGNRAVGAMNAIGMPMAGGRAQPVSAAGTSAINSVGQAGAAGQGGAAGAAGAPAQAMTGAAGATGAAGQAGAAGASGASGAAGQPAAGSGSTQSSGGADPCGADAMPVTGMTSTQGNGLVTIFSSGDVEVIGATMTMLVPKKPQADDTLFLWPGIQPSSSGGVSGFGVLQPVLTWGDSCNGQNKQGWWISGQYVYFTGGFGAKCEGGDIMAVEPGDKLDIVFELKGKVWTQIITSQMTGKSVKFDRDLAGQKQVELLYEIEMPTRNKPSEDVIFTKNILKLSKSQPQACVARSKGAQDYLSPARVSKDGMTCCIDKVILRASGVMMSSPNEP